MDSDLQGYTPKQLQYGTGGPKEIENLYTRVMLEDAFRDFRDLTIVEEDAGTPRRYLAWRHVGGDQSHRAQVRQHAAIDLITRNANSPATSRSGSPHLPLSSHELMVRTLEANSLRWIAGYLKSSANC